MSFIFKLISIRHQAATYCFWSFVLFLCIYSIKFFTLPFVTSQWVILAIMPIAFGATLILKTKFKIRLKDALLSCGPVYINAMYLLVASIASKDSNLVLLQNSVLILLVSYSSYFLAFFLKSSDITFNRLVYLFTIVIFIQAIFILLYYTSPAIKNSIDAILPLAGNYDEAPTHRSRGFYNAPGASLSVIQAIGLLLASFLLVNTSSLFDKFTLLSISIIILISSFLAGRTGILILPLIFLYHFLLSCNGFKKIIRFAFAAFFSLLIFSLVILLFLQAFMLVGGNQEALLSTISWLTDPFNPEMISSEQSIWSTLWSFVIIPTSESDLFWGNTNYYYGEKRPETDIGYIRNIFSLGIFGSLLFYSGYAFIFLYLINAFKTYPEKLLFVFLGVWIFLVEIKEPFLRGVALNFIIFVILHFVMLNNISRGKTLDSI